MFFDKEYSFKGKHAKYVIELKEVLFERNVDVLLLAPILGLAYNRKAYVDNNSNEKTKIFSDVMIKEQNTNLSLYRMKR